MVVDLKVGSSEGGNKNSAASHHPERAGIVRSFAPAGHRHAAEVEQELGLSGVHLSVTSIEMVRGALAPALGIPKGWVYLAVPISGVFTSIFTLGQMLDVLRDRGEPAQATKGGLG